MRDRNDPQLEKLADNATDEAIEDALFDGFDPEDFFFLVDHRNLQRELLSYDVALGA